MKRSVRSWLAATFDASGIDALTVLRSLSDCLHLNLHYSAREEMGTQSAAETLDLGVGTCRDFAFLFMEAARCLGFAARFVTGYLNDRPRGSGPARRRINPCLGGCLRAGRGLDRIRSDQPDHGGK